MHTHKERQQREHSSIHASWWLCCCPCSAYSMRGLFYCIKLFYCVKFEAGARIVSCPVEFWKWVFKSVGMVSCPWGWVRLPVCLHRGTCTIVHIAELCCKSLHMLFFTFSEFVPRRFFLVCMCFVNLRMRVCCRRRRRSRQLKMLMTGWVSPTLLGFLETAMLDSEKPSRCVLGLRALALCESAHVFRTC